MQENKYVYSNVCEFSPQRAVMLHLREMVYGYGVSAPPPDSADIRYIRTIYG